MSTRAKIAVFVSGNGSNLQAIIESIKSGQLNCKIDVVISDNESAYALERARLSGIDVYVLNSKEFASREDFDKRISEEVDKRQIQLIVLAGYMRLLSDFFVDKYEGRILNIHPSLLPAFKGIHGIKDAFDYALSGKGLKTIVEFV